MLRYYIPSLINVKAKGDDGAQGGEQRAWRKEHGVKSVFHITLCPMLVKKKGPRYIPKYNTGAFGGVIYSPARFRRENPASP
jgi:hypothetical protein